MSEYAVLPITALAWTGPNPCPACVGLGVTGERYEMPGTTPTLLVDVICPGCTGCGNGDPEHRDCQPEAHAYPDDDGYDVDNYDDEDQDQEPPCPSCGGRRWNAVQGFNTTDLEGDMIVLKVPCGCATPLMVTGTDPARLAPYPHA